MLVADIKPDEKDQADLPIKTVYSKVSGVYAVYANAERLMVQFSDDDKLAREQRLTIAGLAPLRGEIEGLMGAWRESRIPRTRERARRFDRRTADALIVALQGDPNAAAQLLIAIKTELMEFKSSIGRAEYMFVAIVCTLVMYLLTRQMSYAQIDGKAMTFLAFTIRNHMLLAAGLGCLGALFSIAIGIRNREIRVDFRFLDIFLDASLRILIGAISAFVLFALMRGNVVSLALGGTPLQMLPKDATLAATDLAMHISVVVAFLAGFSERLVGNFLSVAALSGSAEKVADKTAQKTTSQTPTPGKADERNPRGLIVDKAPDNDDDPVDHLDMVADECLCGSDTHEDEQTDDSELPQATGGVEKAKD